MTNIATNHAITYTNSYTCPLNHVSKLLVENLVLFTLSEGLNPSLSRDYKERPTLVPVLVRILIRNGKYAVRRLNKGHFK